METFLLFAAAAITAVSILMYWRSHRTQLVSRLTEQAIALRQSEVGMGSDGRSAGHAGPTEAVVRRPTLSLVHSDLPQQHQQYIPEQSTNRHDGFSMEFSYLDATGQYTRRAVTVQVCDSEHFAGHCHLRGGYRTFAWDNITGFVLLHGTKEVLEVDEARARFA